MDILLNHKCEYYQYLDDDMMLSHIDLVKSNGVLLKHLNPIYWSHELIVECLKSCPDTLGFLAGKVRPEVYHEYATISVREWPESVRFLDTGYEDLIVETIERSLDSYRFVKKPTLRMAICAGKRGISSESLKEFSGVPEVCSVCPELLEEGDFVPGYQWLLKECEAGRTECLKYCVEVFEELILQFRPDLYYRVGKSPSFLIKIAKKGIYIPHYNIKEVDYYRVSKYVLKYWPDRIYKIDDRNTEADELLTELINVSPASAIKYGSSLKYCHMKQIADSDPSLLKCFHELPIGIQEYILDLDLDNIKYILKPNIYVVKKHFFD